MVSRVYPESIEGNHSGVFTIPFDKRSTELTPRAQGERRIEIIIYCLATSNTGFALLPCFW